jgi:FdhD protein
MLKKIECLNSSFKRIEDYVVEEISVRLYGNGNLIAKLNCSPTDLEYLATGYLVSMGYTSHELIKKVDVDFPNIFVDFEDKKERAIPGKLNVDMSLIFRIVNELSASEIWGLTGGTHTAILHSMGESVRCEDVSRSCTVDKTIGKALSKGINMKKSILVLSCRLSKIIVEKAVNVGIPVVVSKAAVTTAGIELAEKAGITLVGFVRGSDAKIYTNPWRIKEE